jgi:hypothetical protein
VLIAQALTKVLASKDAEVIDQLVYQVAKSETAFKKVYCTGIDARHYCAPKIGPGEKTVEVIEIEEYITKNNTRHQVQTQRQNRVSTGGRR